MVTGLREAVLYICGFAAASKTEVFSSVMILCHTNFPFGPAVEIAKRSVDMHIVKMASAEGLPRDAVETPTASFDVMTPSVFATDPSVAKMIARLSDALAREASALGRSKPPFIAISFGSDEMGFSCPVTAEDVVSGYRAACSRRTPWLFATRHEDEPGFA